MEGERQRLRVRLAKRSTMLRWPSPSTRTWLRDAVAIFQLREKHIQDDAENVLISHLGKMPPQARQPAW